MGYKVINQKKLSGMNHQVGYDHNIHAFWRLPPLAPELAERWRSLCQPGLHLPMAADPRPWDDMGCHGHGKFLAPKGGGIFWLHQISYGTKGSIWRVSYFLHRFMRLVWAPQINHLKFQISMGNLMINIKILGHTIFKQSHIRECILICLGHP